MPPDPTTTVGGGAGSTTNATDGSGGTETPGGGCGAENPSGSVFMVETRLAMVVQDGITMGEGGARCWRGRNGVQARCLGGTWMWRRSSTGGGADSWQEALPAMAPGHDEGQARTTGGASGLACRGRDLWTTSAGERPGASRERPDASGVRPAGEAGGSAGELL